MGVGIIAMVSIYGYDTRRFKGGDKRERNLFYGAHSILTKRLCANLKFFGKFTLLALSTSLVPFQNTERCPFL